MTLTQKRNNTLPLIPLRDLVVFPGVIATLFVGRDASRQALSNAGKQQRIALALQRDPQMTSPSSLGDLYNIGVSAKIIQTLSLPDGVIKILVEGIKRVKITELEESVDGFLQAKIRTHNYASFTDQSSIAFRSVLLDELKHFDSLSKKLPSQLMESLYDLEDPHLLLDTVISHCGFDLHITQDFLEKTKLEERYESFLMILQNELTRLSLEEKIKDRIKQHVNKSQREYYLQEQLKAIQKEMGAGGPDDDAEKFLSQAKEKQLPKHVLERIEAEVAKLRSMNPMTAEASVLRGYIEWVLSLPWSQQDTAEIDLDNSAKILDKRHHGLTKIKMRILEYLALHKRVERPKGQILCFVGPPGVGKTSLCKSIAEATQRPFVRCALGGVHDEGEIRGHRKTYVGSMPGKILQSMRKAKALNPVFLLDEIDKVGRDWRGDPSSALLEVLDSEQNSTFADHYIELDYDLSRVFFIATANSLDIAPPLLDRMEIINLEGYTEEEKVEIAHSHLLPKVLNENGLTTKEFSLDTKILPSIVSGYTREAGVRELTRCLSTIARKSLHRIVSGKTKKCAVNASNLSDFLGVEKFTPDKKKQKELPTGSACGLAWSSVGGSTLFVESAMHTGSGKMTLTGHLGQVMNESAKIALSLARGYAQKHSLNKYLFSEFDFHIHIPDGSIPKDGPSAGITITTSLVSLITQTPVFADLAMTGEVTLKGNVQAIGGLKDKLLAALRYGMSRVIIPAQNTKDLIDMPANIKKKLTIIPVSHMDEVLMHALTQPILDIPPRHESSSTNYAS
ncbi:MAG: endopeptidase La [Alphaproteobacteria bacterium]|nr:endopeptidase La [Alphaproteobacteria bacterium]